MLRVSIAHLVHRWGAFGVVVLLVDVKCRHSEAVLPDACVEWMPAKGRVFFGIGDRVAVFATLKRGWLAAEAKQITLSSARSVIEDTG